MIAQLGISTCLIDAPGKSNYFMHRSWPPWGRSFGCGGVGTRIGSKKLPEGSPFQRTQRNRHIQLTVDITLPPSTQLRLGHFASIRGRSTATTRRPASKNRSPRNDTVSVSRPIKPLKRVRYENPRKKFQGDFLLRVRFCCLRFTFRSTFSYLPRGFGSKSRASPFSLK